MLNKRERAEGTLPNKTIEYRFVRGKQGGSPARRPAKRERARHIL